MGGGGVTGGFDSFTLKLYLNVSYVADTPYIGRYIT